MNNVQDFHGKSVKILVNSSEEQDRIVMLLMLMGFTPYAITEYGARKRGRNYGIVIFRDGNFANTELGYDFDDIIDSKEIEG